MKLGRRDLFKACAAAGALRCLPAAGVSPDIRRWFLRAGNRPDGRVGVMLTTTPALPQEQIDRLNGLAMNRGGGLEFIGALHGPFYDAGDNSARLYFIADNRGVPLFDPEIFGPL